MNDLCRQLGIDVPILAAPTGNCAGPGLAAAVSAAGGLGALGLTCVDPDIAAEQVRQIREGTNAPFQVNFALAFPPDALNAILDAGTPVVTFSWGDASPYIPAVRRANALLGIQVTNVAGVHHAVDLGADFLICQGIEAGGHVQSSMPIFDLLPIIIAEAGSVPVVASGGIVDGTGIARVLAAEAQGAMLGTRFLATQESRTHPEYKQQLIQARAGDTAFTVCFDGGWPYAAHRALRNSTLQNWEAHGSPTTGERPGEGEIIAHTATGDPIPRYDCVAPRQGMTGNIEAMCLYAGAGVGAINDLPEAGDLVRRLWIEASSV